MDRNSWKQLIAITLWLSAFVHPNVAYSQSAGDHKDSAKVVTFASYEDESPGVIHKITVADLPQPFATQAVDNGAQIVSRPSGAWPKALPGFKVELDHGTRKIAPDTK
jgi:hypothetical protein